MDAGQDVTQPRRAVLLLVYLVWFAFDDDISNFEGALLSLYVGFVFGSDGEMPLSDETRAVFAAENAALAGQAMRVLAVAGRTLPAADFDSSGDLMTWASDLTLSGLVGIIAPPPTGGASGHPCLSAGRCGGEDDH